MYTSPLEFEFIFADVETLNNMAFDGALDVIKLSYANYFNVLEQYVMMTSGGALGSGVGPLLVSKEKFDIQQINTAHIAIPGIHTTANFLLSYAFPTAANKQEYVFSAIEQAVLDHEMDAGVIIHENRFTYEQKGLHKVLDLGEYWQQQTGLPIPLGGIAIRRNLPTSIQQEVNQLIRQSIEHSQRSLPFLSKFITSHAQEMSEDVMRRHIDLYVNSYSIDLGEQGKKAVYKMAETIAPNSNQELFIT